MYNLVNVREKTSALNIGKSTLSRRQAFCDIRRLHGNILHPGNKTIIVTEEKNSGEKVSTTRMFGAEVLIIPKHSDELGIAHKLRDDYPYHIMLNQFDNDVNPRAHYEHTGKEIVDALDDIDMVVMTAGTGGTMTGVGVRVKEHSPNCKLIAAEPDGSTMINTHGKAHDYLVEGIGSNLIPIVMDKSIIDGFQIATDEESFMMARELAIKMI